jgi:hypothetical protein
MTQQSPNTTIPFSLKNIPTTRTKGDQKKARDRAFVGGLLPMEFQPTPYSVIFGRAKTVKEAVGNQRLRVLADLHLAEYAEATCKVDKSMVVTSIVDAVRTGCPQQKGGGGAFIKFRNHRWYEVDDPSAREKVGYVLRDLLSDRYRSSSKSKVARRKQEQLLCRGGRRKRTSGSISEFGSEGDSAVGSSDSDSISMTSGKSQEEEEPTLPSEGSVVETRKSVVDDCSAKKVAGRNDRQPIASYTPLAWYELTSPVHLPMANTRNVFMKASTMDELFDLGDTEMTTGRRENKSGITTSPDDLLDECCLSSIEDDDDDDDDESGINDLLNAPLINDY